MALFNLLKDIRNQFEYLQDTADYKRGTTEAMIARIDHELSRLKPRDELDQAAFEWFDDDRSDLNDHDDSFAAGYYYALTGKVNRYDAEKEMGLV